MIVQFIIAISLLLILFGAAITIHFIRNKTTKSVNQERRNQLNHELYDIRLEEVEEDIQQGVVEDEESMVAELQYNLLDDIDEQMASKQNNTRNVWIPGVLLLVVASLALYATVGSFKEVNDWEASLQRYPDTYKKLFENNNAQPQEQELEDLLIGLRTHLATQPDDAKGWVLYSRLGRIFKDGELAIGAIEKALQAAPDNIEIELEYIELKMKIGDEYEQATAEIMLKRLLQKDPENYDAWSMYGFIAIQKEDFGAAIQRWEKMLSLVDENSEQANMLKGSIAYAQKKLDSIAESVNATDKSTQTEAVNGVSYKVDIIISNKVTYPDGSTLFIYAQSVNGPAMPIAAIKVPIVDFPVSVTLSDENAMMKSIKLSDYPEFIIKARISVDGTVNQSDGQWTGESKVIKAGQTAPVDVNINQQL